MIKPRFVGVWTSLCLLLCASVAWGDVPTPEQHLGYRAGDDSKLTTWNPVVEYFRRVDNTSPRVIVRELGRTTEDRPYIAAFVSNEETIDQLETHRRRQHEVADPRLVSTSKQAEELARTSKPVVLITCSIHSDETASTFMAMELLHELATSNSPATKEILDKVILILVPSANPDGVEKVAIWYEKSKGHPWEGAGMPDLYHRFAGHDTNRDWFMLNLKETQVLTHLLYHEWYPTITYDVHQMGSRGARLFVPPFFDPVNPNLDPRLNQSIALIGAHMALDLAREGKRGILTNAMYDNWWNGGNRTVPQRHNMVGVLTEAASVRMATPIFIERGELVASSRGFRSHSPAVNFVDPWPGGWWRLRDIVDYELICARSVLTLAARYHHEFQANYAAMARASIHRGKTEPPYGWIVPLDQRDPGTAALMVRTLAATGIEVQQLQQPVEIDGLKFSAGSWILPAAQPYRSHLKDMMERQDYPTRYGPDGNAEPPYDVAGWTLPLKMGVKAVTLNRPLRVKDPLVTKIVAPPLSLPPVKDAAASNAKYQFTLNTNDAVRLVNLLHGAGLKLTVREGESHHRTPASGRLVELPITPEATRAIEAAKEKLSLNVRVVAGLPVNDSRKLWTLQPARVGLYHPHVPSMDEGWTQFVLQEHGFKPVRLTNTEIRVGRLLDRVDTIILPSISTRILKEGYATDQSAPEFVGGLGAEAIRALREFVTGGGTLVCLESSCEFVIEEFGLPIKNVVKGLRGSEFYCPGSILRTEAVRLFPPRDPPASDLTSGLPAELSVYFDRSLVFEHGDGVIPHLRYARVNPLESGWLLGASRLQGKTALATVLQGEGRIVLFGFPPQQRAQTHGTFLLLFNALLGEKE